MITADHQVLNEDQEYRLHHRYAGVVQIWRRNGIKVIHARPNQVKRHRGISETFYFQKKAQDALYGRTSCTTGEKWNFVSFVQSGLQESWWAEALECCCYLRNAQDSLADG